jgi:hypothetical protein
MKTNKTILTLVTLFISFSLMASESAYDKAMTSALTEFGSARTIADLQKTANSFARISRVAPEDWLAPYYESQCYILISFQEKEPSKRDEFLDKAQKLLDPLLSSQAANSEVFALQSMLYTARLTVDPMTRGQEYMALSAGAYNQSLALNPTNPRALYLQLSNEVGMAQFFGEDVSNYCERIRALYSNWKEFNQVEKFHPNWGLNQVEGLMQNCPAD